MLNEKFSVIVYFLTDMLFWGVRLDQRQREHQQEELVRVK